MVWDGIKEYNLDEFSGVTFRWYYGHLEAVTEKETVTLYTGMPIWSVYFYDLTGDGDPELCSTLSFGSRGIRLVTFQQVDHAPDTKVGAQRHNESLQNTNSRIEKMPQIITS